MTVNKIEKKAKKTQFLVVFNFSTTIYCAHVIEEGMLDRLSPTPIFEKLDGRSPKLLIYIFRIYPNRI